MKEISELLWMQRFHENHFLRFGSTRAQTGFALALEITEENSPVFFCFVRSR